MGKQGEISIKPKPVKEKDTQKKQGQCGKQTLLISSIPIYSRSNVGIFGIKMRAISFPFSLYSYLLSISRNRHPFLPKCSEKRGPLTFLSFQPKFHKIFKRPMRPRLPNAVPFAAPFKRVGGGNSRYRGAAVQPVPRGSIHLKSGPEY